MGEIKKMQKKGIFITFMAFLLVSTVLALSIASNQAVIGQEENLAEETAFKTVNTKVDSIMQQIGVVKEGAASEAYGRFMPFKKFSTSENWIEMEQNLPIENLYIDNAIDALTLFAIFAKEEGSEGGIFVNTEVPPNIESTDLKYIVMPQCVEFYVDDSTETFKIEKKTDGICTGNTDNLIDKIEKYQIEIDVPENEYMDCQGDMYDGQGSCENIADPVPIPAIKIEIFDRATGNIETISANLATGNGKATIDIDTLIDEFVIIESTPDLFSINRTGGNESSFNTKVFFKDQINEIILNPAAFGIAIKKPGFSYCSGTSDTRCEFTITKPTIINECQEITNEGTYMLADDMQIQKQGRIEDCIRVNAEKVIIDCAGFKITNSTNNGDKRSTINVTGDYAVIKNCDIYEEIGQGYNLAGISVSADNVVIKNSKIYNYSGNTGIYVDSAENLTIDTVVISGNLDGIYVKSSKEINLKNITITPEASNNGNGIDVKDSSGKIQYSSINGFDKGINITGTIPATKSIALDNIVSCGNATSDLDCGALGDYIDDGNNVFNSENNCTQIIKSGTDSCPP